ncbi:hypothetical protein HAP48_0005405 [Bradyrhizobium septentrionale]|uniref:Uncharacterized protein n=1 Tax=Bradyrhizobium septentrionale TaxID=1404411 RepID=A0A974A4L2_9BRAD|nr:hypothetical protein [Bradyrhizobium septentrionale]UGY16927.1 hypothetical protein HAP48_0005405 [Bradyrhizobium septentrionale]UGY25682.1 hypothetical protein HU675_0002175 [Bradyrhizobium septentrionale]
MIAVGPFGELDNREIIFRRAAAIAVSKSEPVSGGLPAEPVALEDLLKAREHLVAEVAGKMPAEHR